MPPCGMLSPKCRMIIPVKKECWFRKFPETGAYFPEKQAHQRPAARSVFILNQKEQRLWKSNLSFWLFKSALIGIRFFRILLLQLLYLLDEFIYTGIGVGAISIHQRAFQSVSRFNLVKNGVIGGI